MYNDIYTHDVWPLLCMHACCVVSCCGVVWHDVLYNVVYFDVTVMYCAVPYCASFEVLCCAVYMMCCAVLCCAVYTVLCCAVLGWAVLCNCSCAIVLCCACCAVQLCYRWTKALFAGRPFGWVDARHRARLAVVRNKIRDNHDRLGLLKGMADAFNKLCARDPGIGCKT